MRGLAVVFGAVAAHLVVSGITPEQERRWEAAPMVIAVGAAIAMAAAGWLLPRRALSRPPAAHLRARAPAQ